MRDHTAMPGANGAKDRTHRLVRARQALCQLSYKLTTVTPILEQYKWLTLKLLKELLRN